MSRPRPRPYLLVVLLVALLAAVGAGCGRSDSSTSTGAAAGGGGGAPPPGPGFDGTTITLGVITPLSGPVAVIGEPLTNGNRVWFDKINAQGGIAGKYKVALDEQDSRYDPPTAVQLYQRSKGGVAMYTQILGTAISAAVLPQLVRDNIVAAPATLDSIWVRNPNLLPVGAPYQIQAINAMDYTRRTDGTDKKICTLTEDDVYGEAGKAGVAVAADKLGFAVTQAATFRQGDKDFAAQVGQLKGAGCQVVWLTALPTEAATIYGTAAQLGFSPKWYAQSPSWVGALAASPLKPYLEANVKIVAEGPQWGDTSVPGMSELLADVKQFAPDQKADFYFAFGYNQGRAVTALLEKAVERGDLSQAGIKAAMAEMSPVDFRGLGGIYEYGPIDKRSPPRETTIFSVKADAPFGLQATEINRASDAAKSFEFAAAAG